MLTSVAEASGSSISHCTIDLVKKYYNNSSSSAKVRHAIKIIAKCTSMIFYSNNDEGSADESYYFD
jgi:hypothetical protein